MRRVANSMGNNILSGTTDSEMADVPEPVSHSSGALVQPAASPFPSEAPPPAPNIPSSASSSSSSSTSSSSSSSSSSSHSASGEPPGGACVRAEGGSVTPSPAPSISEQISDEIPQCPICMDFYCEPLRTTCNHTFCRLCLLMTTKLSANGRACPMCRHPIAMRDPVVEPEDAKLSEAVHRLVAPEEYQARIAQMKAKIEELRAAARMNLPIFFMPPCPQVGEVIGLHLFEPRYKLLIRRAMEGNAQFVYAGSAPRPGIRATIIQVDQAAFLADGRALIQGRGVQSITLSDVWVEEGTGGLF